MVAMTMSEVARLLKFKNPQNLFHLEKSGKFKPDKNLTGKIWVKGKIKELIDKGYEAYNWQEYCKLKENGAIIIDKQIIDFYCLPVVLVKLYKGGENE